MLCSFFCILGISFPNITLLSFVYMAAVCIKKFSKNQFKKGKLCGGFGFKHQI